MPPTNPLAKLFRSSPFDIMRRHIQVASQCVQTLQPLFNAALENDSEQLQFSKGKIFQLERQADDLKNELRANLPKTLFMPIDRNVLLDALDFQDALADIAQEIAGLLSQRHLPVTPELGQMALELVDSCVETVLQAEKVVSKMDDLVEAGFKGVEAERMREMVSVLANLESETDEKGDAITRALFAQEETLGPVTVLLWYEVFRWTGRLADRAEDVGKRLMLTIAD